jgi:hypothetical protein
MKKSVLTILLALMLVFPLVSAICNLDASMINQDPYPAIPGDYVKVVFQITGIENSECGTVTFELKEDFPISLDPGIKNPISIESGTYQRQYGSFYLAPFQIRVDANAIEGDNPIEVGFSTAYSAEELKEFDLYIQDTRADFEIHVKNYDYATSTLTFEILNIEKVDIEALTLEIPKQEGISIKGANKKVIGDLDSNEYTTADFEIMIPEGESKINVNLIYTDSINVRRSVVKEVEFDSSYFADRNGDNNSKPIWLYVLIIVIVAWIIYRRVKKAKLKKKLLKKH